MALTARELLQRAWLYIRRAPGAIYRWYTKLNILGKLVVWFFIVFEICFITMIIIVTPARVAQFLYDVSHDLSRHPAGWLVFTGALVITSFPPLAGNTTVLTMCGFAYGMKGFFIGAPSESLGSAIVFLVMRWLFTHRIRSWATKNRNWNALEAVIRKKGMPLIVLVRASPLPPWNYANVLFASIDSVSFWQFVLASLVVYPKMALHIFIGSQMASFADGEQRGKMTKTAKIVDGLLIAFGVLLAFAAGGFTYYSLKKHLEEAEDLTPTERERAEEAIFEAEEGAPLLRDFSEDGEMGDDNERGKVDEPTSSRE